MIRAAILTVSDSCARGTREDVSGQVIKEMLSGQEGFEVCEKKTVADDHEKIVNELKSFSDSLGVNVIFTTGGTGLGPRDVTPEATIEVCERMVPGLSEMMRAEGLKKTANAVLSRGVSGIRGNTLIVNLPGSERAVRECLEVIIKILPHAVEMLLGGGH